MPRRPAKRMGEYLARPESTPASSASTSTNNAMECQSPIEIPTSVLALASGGTLAAGLFVFADALLLHSLADVEPMITFVYWLPGLVALFASGMVACARLDVLVDAFAIHAHSGAHCARLWLFFTFMLFFGALAGAIALASSMPEGAHTAYSYIATSALVKATNGSWPSYEYDDERGRRLHAYVGYALIAETALVLISSMLCLATRLRRFDVQ